MDCLDIVHGDEKWFYLMKDGAVCRVFPQFTVNESTGEVERTVQMPADGSVYHKSRMPKVMFLAATARPRPEYGFDGKIGIWPFTLERKAKRSDARTGTVAGETDILESVTVNAEEYRKVMLKKDGVLDAMRSKMWWYKRGSGKPEAGDTLYYQHDGARPHTAKVNEGHWARHGKKGGFKIEVVTQPAQSPDLNCNDLAFFASLQTDTELVVKKNVKDLVEAVKSAWEEYPAERMDSVWRLLWASFKGILSDDGGNNNYSHHTGSRTAHAKSSRAGDKHDRSFPLEKFKACETTRDQLAATLDSVQNEIVSSTDISEDDASSSA